MERVKSVAINTAAGLIIINGIGLLVHSILSGVLMIGAGIFLIPKIQAYIETQTETELSLFTVIAIFGVLFAVSTLVLMNAVDVAEQGPEFLKPHL